MNNLCALNERKYYKKKKLRPTTGDEMVHYGLKSNKLDINPSKLIIYFLFHEKSKILLILFLEKRVVMYKIR